MATQVRGPKRIAGTVNTPYPRELAVQVKDNSGKVVKDNWVSFTTAPPDAIEFAGGQLYATVKTDEKGTASVRFTPRRVGQHRIIAEASDGLGTADFTIEVTDVDGTEVRHMGDDVLVINGSGTRPATHVPMWPVAAMVIVAMVIGGALLLFGRNGGEKSAPTPPVVVHGGGSTVDPDARAKAQAALAAVEAAKQELREETTQGLTENSTHDRGYAREYTRPVMRQAAETARRVKELLATNEEDDP